MRVLVLGGYGLIGGDIVRRLRAEGIEVIGFGRCLERGMRAAPDISWRIADMAQLQTPDAWRILLEGVDAVVNAAGALQDGARDDLAATQDRAVRALIAACEHASVRRFVQISAPGAAPGASIEFLRTKGAADEVLRRSTLDWVVFKPGFVWSANAYGGSALVRQLAAFPLVQPMMLGEASIQTVAGADVADAVAWALSPQAITHAEYDLVEPDPHTLREIVAQVRAWLGYAPPSFRVDSPRWFGRALGRLADGAGWLGWRSPLRTTALRVLETGVRGNPAAYITAGGGKPRPFAKTLALTPATAQDRIFARAQLVFPFLLTVLSAFWCLSGAIGLLRWQDAASVLSQTPAEPMAPALVLAGAAFDIAIGIALLFRASTVMAAWAAVCVSLVYLAMGTAMAPHLWADPLGPLVKVLPQMALAIAVAALAQER